MNGTRMADRSKDYANRAVRIQDDLVAILKRISSGWEPSRGGEIGPRSLLGADLSLKSLDIARLVGAIREHYQIDDLPFHELFMPENTLIKDLSVADVVAFLSRYVDRT